MSHSRCVDCPKVSLPAEDSIQLNKALGELLKYSLVRRDPKTKTLTVHHLVQTVLKDGMDEYTKRQWSERAVRAVECTFPNVSYSTWPFCQRCLLQAKVCAEHIELWNMNFLEAAQLLNKVGHYLSSRELYAEAEPLYQEALEIYKQLSGLDNPSILNNLASLYREQLKYEEAEQLYQRAIVIGEKTLGSEHPNMATILENYAYMLIKTNQVSKAAELFANARAIRAKHAQGIR